MKVTVIDTNAVGAPSPWHVGVQRTPRSMFPIRDSNDKVVAFARREEIAQLIVELRGDDE